MQQELKFFEQNKNTIESLRNENEIIEFFKANNFFVDKNFLNKIKLKYKANNSSKLNNSQLEQVAGGGRDVISTRKSDYCLRNRRVPADPEAQNMSNANHFISVPSSTTPPPTSPMSPVELMPLTDENPRNVQPPAKRSHVDDKDENLVPLLQPLAVEADAGNSVVSLNISQKDNEAESTFHWPTPSPSLFSKETESPALESYWGGTELFFYEAQSNSPGVHAEEMNLSCEGTGFPEYTQLFSDGTVSFTQGIEISET